MHDALRQADFLRQTLTQDKRPFGILVGAGCPVAVRTETNEALIPDIAGITGKIAADLGASPLAGAFRNLLGQLQVDGIASPTIEDLLTHIRSLRQVVGAQEVRGLNREQLNALDLSISDAIVQLVNRSLPDRHTPYHSLAQWIAATQRSEPVEVFTTNYDLLTEQALEATRVPTFDGFVGAHAPFFDNRAIDQDVLPTRWCRVWKLHGSINWQLRDGGNVVRIAPTTGQVGRVIHPSHLKYDESRRMPYLALIDRFRAFLRKPSAVLVTSGFSFRDEHINEVISQALYANPSLIVFALMFGEIEQYGKATQTAQRHRNLSVLAENAAVVGRRQGPWHGSGAADTIAAYAPAVILNPENRVRFRLGNFATLGEFLDAIVGQNPTPSTL